MWAYTSYPNSYQGSATTCYTGETFLCNIPGLNGCHSSVTVLTANTTQIKEICTPRNLFLVIRVAYTSAVQWNSRILVKFFIKDCFVPAELKRQTKVLQFDICCKSIGQDFDFRCARNIQWYRVQDCVFTQSHANHVICLQDERSLMKAKLWQWVDTALTKSRTCVSSSTGKKSYKVTR